MPRLPCTPSESVLRATPPATSWRPATPSRPLAPQEQALVTGARGAVLQEEPWRSRRQCCKCLVENPCPVQPKGPIWTHFDVKWARSPGPETFQFLSPFNEKRSICNVNNHCFFCHSIFLRLLNIFSYNLCYLKKKGPFFIYFVFWITSSDAKLCLAFPEYKYGNIIYTIVCE